MLLVIMKHSCMFRTDNHAEERSMKNNMLRAPLIKSAVLLTIFSLLVYMTATSPDGSVWNSLGTIFLAVFRAAQLAVGLVLALSLCFIVLAGIFLGGVALVSRESAVTLYEQLGGIVVEKLRFVRALVKKDEPAPSVAGHTESGTRLKEEVLSLVNSAVAPLHSGLAVSENMLEDLRARLDQMETETVHSLAGGLEQQKDRSDQMAQAVALLREELQQMQAKLAAIAGQLQELQGESAVSGLASRIDAVEKLHRANEQVLDGLTKHVKALQNDVERHATAAAADIVEEDKPSDSDSGTRLFAHLEKPEARGRIEQLVTEALQQEMTYAQVSEYLVQHTDAATAEVLKAHPSLTKDYIRYRRQNG